MRALIVDHSAPRGLRVGEAPDPVPLAHQALVAIHAASINYGDVIDNVEDSPDGTVPGWEAAGIVVAAAADGSGPASGTPVVTFGWSGAWAELRAVDTSLLSDLPDGTDLGAVATVPIAGVSALAALDRIGPTLGRSILVTGATGGVGRYAVQLARLGAGTDTRASSVIPCGSSIGSRSIWTEQHVRARYNSCLAYPSTPFAGRTGRVIVERAVHG